MPIAIQVEATVFWVPAGAAPGVLGQAQANFAGYGATAPGPGSVGNAQKLLISVVEGVPGTDPVTSANINTALTTAVTDLVTKLNASGSTGFSATGQPSTPLAVIQGWSTGTP
jgi:hypothetical protein